MKLGARASSKPPKGWIRYDAGADSKRLSPQNKGERAVALDVDEVGLELVGDPADAPG